MLKLENTYWNSKGKYQTFLEEKLDGDLIETLPINEKLKEKYRKIGRMYYRFFNDGDTPEHYIITKIKEQYQRKEKLNGLKEL